MLQWTPNTIVNTSTLVIFWQYQKQYIYTKIEKHLINLRPFETSEKKRFPKIHIKATNYSCKRMILEAWMDLECASAGGCNTVLTIGGEISTSAFEIQVLSTLTIKCQSNFRIFYFASAIRQQKNCQRLPKTDTFVYYVGNGFNIPRYFAKGYGLIFKKWDYLFYLNYIVYLSRVKPKITLFWFLCVSLL